MEQPRMENTGNLMGKLPQKSTPQTLPYFSLPGEIRNQIMRELLMVGDIVVQPRPSTQERAPEKGFLGCVFAQSVGASTAVVNHILGRLASPIRTAPSIGAHPHGCSCLEQKVPRMAKYHFGCSSFLATCRQARREGSYVFYGENTFHVPLGPAEDMKIWMDDLHSVHRALIPTIVVRFSLADLSRDQCLKLLGTEEKCKCKLSNTVCKCYCNSLDLVKHRMRYIWLRKLTLLMVWGQVNCVYGSPRLGSNDSNDHRRLQTDLDMVSAVATHLDRFDFAQSAVKMLGVELRAMDRGKAYESVEFLYDDLVKAGGRYEFVFVATRTS